MPGRVRVAGHADAGRRGCARRDVDVHGGTHCAGDAHPDADRHEHEYPHAKPDVYVHAFPDANSDQHRDGNSFSFNNAHTDIYAYPHSGADPCYRISQHG